MLTIVSQSCRWAASDGGTFDLSRRGLVQTGRDRQAPEHDTRAKEFGERSLSLVHPDVIEQT
jgi:hypothetical protein